MAEAMLPLGGNEYGATFIVDQLPLLSGRYTFSVGLLDGSGSHFHDHRVGACPFEVRNPSKELGVMRIPHRWGPP